MSLALTLTLLAAAAPEPPEVRYVVTAETKSWEPIDLPEVQRMVEEAAKEPLTAPGKMRLVSASPMTLSEGPYVLRISGRFVEEAERFTVYLAFGPGTQDDLPSLVAAHTSEPLGKKSRAEMERRIRDTARQAALRLAEALTPWLDRARLNVAPPLTDDVQPMAWGDVDVPPVTDKSPAIRTLLDVAQENHLRAKALAELKGHVFDQQAARNAVEQCALADPTPDIRQDCVEALAPVARAHVPTQRILLHILRTDVDDKVLEAATKVSAGFVGLSRLETVATWLHMVASDATPVRGAEQAARLLAKEKEIPNLEYAVAACLRQDAVVYGKRYACAQYLLPKIPGERRRPVMWSYLAGTPVFGTGERLTYEQVLKVAYEDRKAPPDPAMAGLLLDLAERPATGRLRYKVVYLAGDYAPATLKTAERLLSLAHQQDLASNALRAAGDLAHRNPELVGPILGGLDQLEASARWYPQPHRGDPRRDLSDLRKRLVRLQEKKQ
ncbi:MAG: hypothetical protein KC933_18110 [Myxococcales bacterium]|nr:hypothetical protein [Myxococcales bacterium]